LITVKDRLMTAAQDEMRETFDKGLAAEILKIERWAADEIAALEMTDPLTDAEIKRLKSAQESATSFADEFKINKQLADLKKRQKAAADGIADKTKIINHKKQSLVDAARTKSGAKFWEEMSFCIRFCIE
jgi:2-oxoglutarate dehydrogenase complex dehydrogenase (E1) component-like enzyme